MTASAAGCGWLVRAGSGRIGGYLSTYLSADVSGPAAQQAARRELSKPEYHRDDPGLISRILSWVAHRLDFLLNGSLAGSASLTVAALLVLAVIAAVWRAGRTTSPTSRPARAHDPLSPGADVDHWLLAEKYAAAGRDAESLREWLRAAVQAAEQRGLIEPRPGRTGDEFAREVGLLLPTAADHLAAAATAFDLVWFAGQLADAAGVTAARHAAEDVRSARIQRPVRQ